MAYRSYAGRPGDYFADANGAIRVDAVATVWSALTGGVQVTDLVVRGVATSTITPDSDGSFIFNAQDTLPSVLFVFVAGMTHRFAVDATLLGAQVDAQLATITALTATVNALIAQVNAIPATAPSLLSMNTAIDAAIQVEVVARDAAIEVHNTASSVLAHVNKVSAMNGPTSVWKAGNVPGVGSVPMPTTAGGVLVGHYVYNNG